MLSLTKGLMKWVGSASCNDEGEVVQEMGADIIQAEAKQMAGSVFSRTFKKRINDEGGLLQVHPHLLLHPLQCQQE